MNPVLAYFLSEEALRAGLSLTVPRAGDAGFDLPCLEDVTIAERSFKLLRTGVHLGIPEGWVGLLRDRSSVALRGAAVTAGVIDASYRGEVKVAMHNLGPEPLVFSRGERIAQCVVVPHLPGTGCMQVESMAALGATERGKGGFGSTGR